MASIRKRVAKNGDLSYSILAFIGKDQNGKNITKAMTWKAPAGWSESKAEKEAEKQAALFEDKVKNGVIAMSGGIKFADYVNQYLEVKELRKSTRIGYENMLKRIIPAIGHIPLDKLKAMHIEQFIKNLRDSNFLWAHYTANRQAIEAISKCTYSKLDKEHGINRRTTSRLKKGEEVTQKTVHKVCAAFGLNEKTAFTRTDQNISSATVFEHFSLISKILNHAKKKQIVRDNVTDFVERPKVKRKEVIFYDDNEAGAFGIALLQEPCMKTRTFLLIAIVTGMRCGELCGLEWDDIDFDNCIIHVRRQALTYQDGSIDPNAPPKTNSSYRSITVTPFIMNMIDEYRQWQDEYIKACGDTWEQTDKLFTGETGKPINTSMPRFWLNRFTDKHGLRKITLHGLRHTFITLQIASGVDIRTLQARTGHAKASTLLDVYSHAIDSQQAKAAQAMDAMLLQPPTSQAALPSASVSYPFTLAG